MSMDYIRNRYNVPARKGMQVKAIGKLGVITGAYGHYLLILIDGEKHSKPYHPTYEIDYYPKEEVEFEVFNPDDYVHLRKEE